jgi:hypothetical protein
MSQLGLTRAYAFSQKPVPPTWKDAGPDLLILKQVKAEYTKLK